jgi:hypothetical protein
MERVLSVNGFATGSEGVGRVFFSVTGRVSLLVLYEEGGRTHGFASAAEFSRAGRGGGRGRTVHLFASVESISFAMEGDAVSVERGCGAPLSGQRHRDRRGAFRREAGRGTIVCRRGMPELFRRQRRSLR